MEIGEKIRKLRADAGLTQDELAAKLLVTCIVVVIVVLVVTMGFVGVAGSVD